MKDEKQLFHIELLQTAGGRPEMDMKLVGDLTTIASMTADAMDQSEDVFKYMFETMRVYFKVKNIPLSSFENIANGNGPGKIISLHE